MTRKEIISRLRNPIKEVSSDTKYTNRYLWNVFQTNLKILLKQESDRSRIYNQSNIWETICVKMDKVSPILCDCLKLPMDCVVYRSRFKLPNIIEGTVGKIYRFIATLDLSNQFVLVTPFQYQQKQTKYNKEKYAFIHDGYLFTPNAHWSHLIISAIFEEEIDSQFKCDSDEDSTGSDACGVLLHLESPSSDWLLQSAISMALTELGASKQVRQDELPNSNSNEIQAST